jgi:hypothetical protein
MARVIAPADFQRFYPFDSGRHRQPLQRTGLPCSGVSVSAEVWFSNRQAARIATEGHLDYDQFSFAQDEIYTYILFSWSVDVWKKK